LEVRIERRQFKHDQDRRSRGRPSCVHGSGSKGRGTAQTSVVRLRIRRVRRCAEPIGKYESRWAMRSDRIADQDRSCPKLRRASRSAAARADPLGRIRASGLWEFGAPSDGPLRGPTRSRSRVGRLLVVTDMYGAIVIRPDPGAAHSRWAGQADKTRREDSEHRP
jgi:hypothetical protein